MNSVSRRAIAIPLLLLLVGLAGIGWLAIRPAILVTSARNPLITIECSGATGASPTACQAWGDAILAADPAPHTFEREDLRRLSIDRSLLGFGDCSVAYYISRYADGPVWSGAVACR